MDFISRDEYLTERRRWKKEYLRLSRNIHELKVATKKAAKGGWTEAQALQSVRARLSNNAYDMMLDLEDLKEESRQAVNAIRMAELFQDFLKTTNFRI